MLQQFESHIAEYEERMGNIASGKGFELLMCHTVIDRKTGDMLSGAHTTITDRPSNAIASMMQVSQLYTSLSQ